MFEVANTLARKVPDSAAAALNALISFGLVEGRLDSKWLRTALSLVRDYGVRLGCLLVWPVSAIGSLHRRSHRGLQRYLSVSSLFVSVPRRVGGVPLANLVVGLMFSFPYHHSTSTQLSFLAIYASLSRTCKRITPHFNN